MGLARGAIALLLEEAKRKPFSGRIATLGKQTIYASNREIEKQFAKFDVRPNGPADWRGSAIDDVQLFKLFGFDTVHSFDYSDFEGADFVVDLNQPGMPTETVGAYDVVLDSGTLEHVFHLPNALANLIELAKVGGRIILLSPSSNHIDHGFYMFSPTLFSDYFAANRLRMDTIYVVRYSIDNDTLWEAYAYEPGAWRDLQIGGLDANPYVIFVVATRTAESITGAIPQQSYYSDSSSLYTGSSLASDIASGASVNPAAAPEIPVARPIATAPTVEPRPQPIKTVLRRIPGARSLAYGVRALLRHSAAPRVDQLQGALNKKLRGRY